MYPVGTKTSTRTVTTARALSKLFINPEFTLTSAPDTQHDKVIFSHLGEEDFVVGLEVTSTLECLLEPEREHDQPSIIRVATRENG